MNFICLFLYCCLMIHSRQSYGKTYNSLDYKSWSPELMANEITQVKKVSLQNDVNQASAKSISRSLKFNPVLRETKVKVKASGMADHVFTGKLHGSSMKVGEHLVKVTSVKNKSRVWGNDASVEAQFSHMIEILPFNDSEVGKKVLTGEDSSKPVNASPIQNVQISEKVNMDSKSLDTLAKSQTMDVESIVAPLDGNGVSLSDQIEGSGEETFKVDFENRDLKSGRILDIFSRQNDTAQSCITPKGETGKCRRFRDCLLNDALNNFNNFLQYLCLIRGVFVGFCCPNNPVVEITNPDNSTESNAEIDIRQPPEGCGLNTKTRIVGGSISVPHEWSWMVALMRRNRFYCGGVVINNWYILTAAHCVLGVDVKDLAVRFGEYNFSKRNDHREDISVAEIKRHGQFVTLTFQHDIALLKLRRSIRYTKFVGSICLPVQTSKDYADVNGTVVGWGTVSFGGAASPVLRQVTVPVWKNEECDQTYLLENINDSFLCAGSPEKGEDACQGDSGGPLMALNDRGRWEVIGIVSWGRRCGDPTYPGVYTRVTKYLDWIAQNAV